LSDAQARAIAESDIDLSAASVREIGIKRALGKLDVPEDVFEAALMPAAGRWRSPGPMPWRQAPCRGITAPLDRMLIAQARCDGVRLASSDT
jgi:PIN domain nuclease of toxin-antitoxin system